MPVFNDQSPLASRWYSLQLHGAEYPLSDNFTVQEFACHDGQDLLLVHSSLLEALQELRAELGNSRITVNSGFRSPAYNRSIGGKPNSRHLWGMAADIVVERWDPVLVAERAEELGFGGVGRYNTFTHVDVWGVMRRWDKTD